MPGRVVITGGAGYVGHRLGLHVASKCPELGSVVLFDLKRPSGVLPEGVEAAVGDLRSPQDVNNVMKDATLVFHVASYGMSGYEAMDEDTTKAVNVNGTQNVIDACLAHGVTRLVYVSSYNAVFDGRTPIIAGDEDSCKWVTPATTSAAYSWTKAAAEQLVLGADSKPTRAGTASGKGAVLRTTVIRPGGIWGPGEQRHIPRIVEVARRGWLQFVFGPASALVDWLHVDNLIAALLLAAGSLQQPGCPAGGQVFFVHDGEPENNFAFLQPIFTGLGYTWPRLRLPYRLVYVLAWLMELVATVARNVAGHVVWVPVLCRMEVAKCGISHYAKIDRARKVLGYEPTQYRKQDVVDWFKARGYAHVPPHPVVLARARARNTKLCIAVLVCLWILHAWHTAVKRREAEEAGNGAAQELLGAGGPAGASGEL